MPGPPEESTAPGHLLGPDSAQMPVAEGELTLVRLLRPAGDPEEGEATAEP